MVFFSLNLSPLKAIFKFGVPNPAWNVTLNATWEKDAHPHRIKYRLVHLEAHYTAGRFMMAN